MASRLGDCAQDPRERDAANARLPDRRRAASLANRDRRGSEPARIVLPKSRVDVPEEAGLLRPRPSGNRLRLPPSSRRVLCDGELRTVPVRRRSLLRDASRRASAGRGRPGRILLRGPEGRTEVRAVHVFETGRDAERSDRPPPRSAGLGLEMTREAGLVFVGGRIFTAARIRPWAGGMAILDDRFVAVGTESQVERWTGRRTRRIDLHGHVVVPGFIDAHAHMADSAGEIGWTRLSGTRSMEDALARLRKAATNTPAGEWVVGIDWDEAKWTDRRYPTRVDLDRVSTDHPVVARRIDCHMGSVNSLALERARDLVGLRGFDVDGSGRPTGILKEDAFSELHDRFASGPAVIERNLPRIAQRSEERRVGKECRSRW